MVETPSEMPAAAGCLKAREATRQLAPEDHCVHLVQIRAQEPGLPLPPEAFEVWVVHRGLCRFCSPGADVDLDLKLHVTEPSGFPAGPRSNARAVKEAQDAGRRHTVRDEQHKPRDDLQREPQRPASGRLRRPQSAGDAAERKRPLPQQHDTSLSRAAAFQRLQRRSRLVVRQEKAQRLRTFDGVPEFVTLARKMNMDITKARELKASFDKFDSDGNGLLDPEEFRDMLQSLVVYNCGERVASQFLEDRWFDVGADVSGSQPAMDLEGFFIWYQAHAFEEALLVPAQNRLVRSLSKEHDLDASFTERVHKIFTEFDADGSMAIEYAEFRAVVLSLLGAKEGQLPEAHLAQFWNDAKQPHEDSLDFEAFLTWYAMHFGGGGEKREQAGGDLLRGFYRSLRPAPFKGCSLRTSAERCTS